MSASTSDKTIDIAPVVVPKKSFASDVRAVKIVWHRELLRFWADKPRLFAALLQPILYLFVFGSGLSSMVPKSAGVDLRLFLLPGVIAMAVLFTCFFSAGSLVWDREFGFLREMLVAPVRRSAILVGKCLGSATTGVFQGLVVLALGALVGVPYSAKLVATVFVELVVLSFGISAFGVLMACRIKSIQSFMALVQMVLMPLFFLSGALFPLRGLPSWLVVLTRLDPLTYGVDPIRRAVLDDVSSGKFQGLGVTWGTFVVPTALELFIVFAFGVLALMLATREFAKAE